MKIVIAGAGEVGSHLAKLLSHEEQDILVIDENVDKLNILDSNLNLMTFEGCPTSFKTLREARVGSCDLFIAVTPYEAENVVACSIAKNLGAANTVARINSYDFMEEHNRLHVKKMGVDRLIYPEYLAAQEILTALRYPWVRHWFELHDGAIIVVGVKIRTGAPIIGMQLKDFSSENHNFHVSAIKREHEIIIPRGNDSIEDGDIIYIASLPNNVTNLLELTGKTNRRVKKVMIMGGGKISVRFAALAENEFKIKIIDNDAEVCRLLPEKCPDCEISIGDARDIDILQEEGICDYDAFIALTGSSEANILTCLTAKELGVRKTIAEVEAIQYINQAENLNIGTIINKKLLASSSIFQLLLDSDDSTSKCLALADAEVAEIEAKPKSKICSSAVKDLHLPQGMTIAGLVRDGQGMLVNGNTVIQPGDHAVVFSLSGSLHKVERLFN
jgi:trk system potassium uptake protein TrkA